MRLQSRNIQWLLWTAVTLALAAWLAVNLLGDDKSLYLPGATSHGHYQIELACEACHSEAFGGGAVLQDSCVACHGAELEVADDSHPKSKFTDPRNAQRVAKLDARQCITCHVEHRPEITAEMGVTVAGDVCFHCHEDIADDRPSHAGMAFDTCASAGCHNFHDNRGLYEDFLLKHAAEPDVHATAALPGRDLLSALKGFDDYPVDDYPVERLVAGQRDLPPGINDDPLVAEEWAATAHAGAGVNCTACHAPTVDGATAAVWQDRPGEEACRRCHVPEVEGFVTGRHGMRRAQDLPPMQPGMARLPMRVQSRGKQLGCMSCHSAHRFDTRHAAVDACLGCHADEHSLAYKSSPHYRLWLGETGGQGAPGTGVSCASCHLPRIEHAGEGETRILVQHNQNDNLRPNEKMLRSVCMNCHGLGFAIDALADAGLVRRNFDGRPAQHIESIDMALTRVKKEDPADARGADDRQ